MNLDFEKEEKWCIFGIHTEKFFCDIFSISELKHFSLGNNFLLKYTSIITIDIYSAVIDDNLILFFVTGINIPLLITHNCTHITYFEHCEDSSKSYTLKIFFACIFKCFDESES